MNIRHSGTLRHKTPACVITPVLTHLSVHALTVSVIIIVGIKFHNILNSSCDAQSKYFAVTHDLYIRHIFSY
jgi:hypothetical protein